MIAVLDPSSPSSSPLSRLYDRERPPFRLTPKTMLAVGLVAALHLGIGLVIARGYFAPAAVEIDDPGIKVTTYRTPPPKPIIIPPRTQTPLKAPPKEVAAFIPHEPLTTAPTDVETVAVPPAHDGADSGPVLPPQILDPPKPPPPPPAPFITNPNWISMPTADQIGKLYPQRAIERSVGGKAVLLCEVQATGAVVNCSVIDETPKGYRFGEAAQAMTRYFKLSPRTVDGVSVAGSKVRIPIVFNPG
jgi:protein TonB